METSQMKQTFLKALGALVLALSPVGAYAQSNPGLVYGQVPTAAQWNGYFAAKQDYTPITPPTTAIVAVCDGHTDTTSTINDQLLKVGNTTGGTAVLPAGSCLITSTIYIPTGVTLSGRGGALNWGAIGPSATVIYPTRLIWGAVTSSGTMVALAPTPLVVTNAGIQNLTIDGTVANGDLATSSLKGVQITSSLGFNASNLDFQNIGVGMSFEPTFTNSSPNNLTSWGHYENIHMLNVGYCARFTPNRVSEISGGTTNNYFYDFVCYSFYKTGLDFAALADDNRFDGLYLASGISNSKGVVFNSQTPSIANGVYANDLLNAEIDNSDTTGTQSSLVVNNSNTFSTIFQGIIGNEGSHNDPIEVNSGGSLYYWDTANGAGPVFYSGNAEGYGLQIQNSSSTGSAGLILGNDINTGLGQIVVEGSANSGLGGNNSVNIVNSTANPVDIYSNNILAGQFSYTGTQILGVTSSTAATAGYLGEDILSDIPIGSAVSLVSNTSKTITSILLTPGDWQVCGNVWTAPAGGTVTSSITGGISTTTNVLPTAPGNGAETQWVGSSTGISVGQYVGCVRALLSTNTTYYLVTNATFASSTLSAYGHLEARRTH